MGGLDILHKSQIIQNNTSAKGNCKFIRKQRQTQETYYVSIKWVKILSSVKKREKEHL